MTKYDEWREQAKYQGIELSDELKILAQIDIAESLSIICQHLDDLKAKKAVDFQ